MFALVKPFLIAVSIIVFLLFAMGMIKIEKSDYACFHGKHLRFDKKLKVMDVGALQLYAYPLIMDCPEDERYDPATVYKCGYQTYCQRDSNETTGQN
jgi:hypothetical protein